MIFQTRSDGSENDLRRLAIAKTGKISRKHPGHLRHSTECPGFASGGRLGGIAKESEEGIPAQALKNQVPNASRA
ncbi:hypothetical protein [Yinghuangia sp. YIM S09857]|uniref:hypothetical protein n=1 Tax=Yinghuangia sp. YIM S09857 TaxID=3436929 RepID=UPI003F535DC6